MAIAHPEPIEAIISRFHTPPVARRGDRSGRLWWVCPFHDDRNPSLCVTPGHRSYRCFGCGAHGDAIDFVRQLNPDMTFREAAQAIG
jgi:DNA primase